MIPSLLLRRLLSFPPLLVVGAFVLQGCAAIDPEVNKLGAQTVDEMPSAALLGPTTSSQTATAGQTVPSLVLIPDGGNAPGAAPWIPVTDDALPAVAALPSDLWQRVRTGFAMPDLDDDFVRQRERFYADKPDYLRRMAERGRLYLHHVVEEIERRNMPTELALLPFVESAFNPQAMSVAKASGMWQFIPSTGKDYALTQNIFRDDRRDVLASTRAALDYLDRLHGLFGDWHLALAAYNWGEGNVRKAITRNEKAGLPTDYSSLRMPMETRHYVPKLQALKNIVLQPAQFGVNLPALPDQPYFTSVSIDRDIDVNLASRLAGVSQDEFRRLNPQMNKPIILAAGTEQILLPFENATLFQEGLKSHPGPFASWTAWVAPRTMHPAEVAKLVGMPERQLREVNLIPAKVLVKAGSTLLVPRTAQRSEDVSEHLADNAMMSLAPEPTVRATIRAAKGGETVAEVARRQGIPVAKLAAWNKISAKGKFKSGAVIALSAPAAGKAKPERLNARLASNNTAKSGGRTNSGKVVKQASKGKAPVKVALR